MSLPPAGLSGLDARWSREVTAPDSTGVARTWHVLDSHAGLPEDTPEPVGTLLCVHGNPSWSYLWRRLVAAAAGGLAGHRDRPPGHGLLGAHRHRPPAGAAHRRPRLAHRCARPHRARRPVRHHGRPRLGRSHLAGLGACATSTSWPVSCCPTPPCTSRPTRRTDRHPRRPAARAAAARSPRGPRTFIRAGLFLSRPVPPPEIRAGYYAPYAEAGRGDGHRGLRRRHPAGSRATSSAAPLDAIADGLGALADVPVLLLWGPRDPVFSDLYLRDLIGRLPHADVHRYEGSSHFVPEDAPTFAADVATWVGSRSLLAEAGPSRRTRARCPTPAGRCGRGSASGPPTRRRAGPRPSPSSGPRGHGHHQLRRAGRPGRQRGRGAGGDRRPAR